MNSLPPQAKIRIRYAFVALGVLILLSRAFAAPDSPIGLVFYESGRTTARSFFGMAVILKEGGKFEGVYDIASSLAAPSSQSVVNPEDGTWSYRKVSDQTAELTLRSASGYGPFSGSRTLQFSSDTTGTALHADFSVGEFRLVSPSTTTPLLNCSNRSFVRNGGSAFTGFVVGDGTSRTVLIRAVGPGLAPFGVTGVLRTPQIAVHSARGIIANSGGWADKLGLSSDASLAISRSSALVGAFPLPTGSKDSATIITLANGSYVVEVGSADIADSGEVLIEVYMLP